MSSFLAGGLGGAVTPVPFPNTDVKGPRGDGTTPRSVGEQRAAGLSFQAPRLRFEAGGPFFSRGAGPARLHAAQYYAARLHAKYILFYK